MKTSTSLLLVASLLFLATGCFPFHKVHGDGNVVTQTISITDYDEITTEGSMTIHYTQSAETPFLEITTDQNIYDMYEFRVTDGHKLLIRPKEEFRRHTSFRPTTFVVNTHSTTLKEAGIAGDSEFHVESTLTTEALKVNLAGSGIIALQDTVRAGKVKTNIAGSGTARVTYVACDTFKGEIAGSGEIFVAGTANEASFSIAGSGDVHGFDLVVANLKGEIAGSGTIEIHATNDINVKGAGSGNIYYKGSPKNVNSSIAGSGKVKAVEE